MKDTRGAHPGAPPPLVYAPPARAPLRTLYVDKDLVIVDKPSGLFSIPGPDPAHADSALLRIREVFPTALVVHRLDLGTSGVLVFALRRKAEAALRAQFQAHTIGKRYLARVGGALRPDEGRVELSLAPDPERPPLQRVDPHGKPAQTAYTVRSRTDGTTLVELAPVTGRTHQLRVHLAALGHPILGDALYAPPDVAAAAPRLLLHAWRLTLAHPWSGVTMTFEAPIPLELGNVEGPVVED